MGFAYSVLGFTTCMGFAYSVLGFTTCMGFAYSVLGFTTYQGGIHQPFQKIEKMFLITYLSIRLGFVCEHRRTSSLGFGFHHAVFFNPAGGGGSLVPVFINLLTENT